MSDARSEETSLDETTGIDTRLIWAMLFFALAVYAKFPGLDLIVSSRYFDSARGFVHAQDPFVLLL